MQSSVNLHSCEAIVTQCGRQAIVTQRGPQASGGIWETSERHRGGIWRLLGGQCAKGGPEVDLKENLREPLDLECPLRELTQSRCTEPS